MFCVLITHFFEMLVINVFPSSAIVPGRPIYTYWYISGIVVETKNNLKQYTMKHVQMEGFCVRDRQMFGFHRLN